MARRYIAISCLVYLSLSVGFYLKYFLKSYFKTKPIQNNFQVFPRQVICKFNLLSLLSDVQRRMGEFEKVNVTPNDKEAFTTITLNSGGIKAEGKLFEVATRENKRKRMDEADDLTDETVAEIIATIDDPKYMTGPNVIIQFFVFFL